MNGANLGAMMSNDNFSSRQDLIDQSIAAGMPISKAMLLGAEFDLKQNQAQRYAAETEAIKQKQMQAQLIQSKLSEFGVTDPSDVNSNFNRFVQAGIEPTAAATIATQLAELPFQQQKTGLQMQESEAKRIRDQEETLRKEYIATSKPFQEVSRAYSKISKALTQKNPSAADDMAAVYALIKLPPMPRAREK